MLRTVFRNVMLTALIVSVTAIGTQGQQIAPVNENEAALTDQVRIDRYLDVEVWTNHSDNEYYDGDDVILYFRANRDAFVAIYTIDTHDRVHLLFPSRAGQDNYIKGGETYRLPSYDDEFDLVVSGPDGVENIQIIASRERFPIPDWYDASGLLSDAADVHDYMDYINSRYFVGYNGQKFAYDRTALYVSEWEPSYFRPIYRPYYPSWTVAGNVYIDYPYGSSIYIDGVYWGCAPLYIPRIYVGWHTITVYDRWNHCWERDVHVTHYNTVVLNRTIVQTSPKITSQYERVRVTGYKDPVKAGYANYHEKYDKAAKLSSATVTTKNVDKSVRGNATTTEVFVPATKKFVRGSSELTQTTRGYEPSGTGYGTYTKDRSGSATTTRTATNDKGRSSQASDVSVSKRSTASGNYERKTTNTVSPGTSTRSTSDKGNYQRKTTTNDNSSDYYRKKSGTTYRKTSPGTTYTGSSNDAGKRKAKGTKTYTAPKTKSSGKSGDSGSSDKTYRKPATSTPKSSGSDGGSTKSSPRTKTSTTKKSGGKR